MKFKFPRIDLSRVKKQMKRYTPNKEGAKRLEEDVSHGLDNLSDFVDRKTERNDPIYFEPVYKKPTTEDTPDLVLTRGHIDFVPTVADTRPQHPVARISLIYH